LLKTDVNALPDYFLISSTRRCNFVPQWYS